MTSSARTPGSNRRTHAERTAETRTRIKAAVVESISQLGYQRATASEIARRAGVTWGAVQHHFGDKDGILLAVLSDSFERFAETLLPDGPPEDLHEWPLSKRVSTFVERAWLHFSSAEYLSTFEILLNLPADLEVGWQGQMLESWQRIWRDFFPESRLPKSATARLQQYTISVLSGISTMKMLGGSGPGARAPELRLLIDTLVRELDGPDPKGPISQR